MDFEYETVLVRREQGIATVTLNRPEKRNAMNPQMHADMYDVIQKLEGDPETRVLVITGAGNSFCAGQDLKEYFKDNKDDESARIVNGRRADDWRNRLLRMFPKPTIAMVNGYCFGGAFTIVCSCDIAIAADDAVFGLSEVNWGSIPGGMVSKVIASTMMFRDALYYAMTAETFDGRQAAEIKLVNRSVPRDLLEVDVMTLAAKLASMDGPALRATKEAIKQVVDMSYEQAYWWLMAKSNELRWRHDQGADEHFAGIDRFLDKGYRPGYSSHTEHEDPQAEPPPKGES
jgi:trans-feruloyl-CoA hydratase/vanillin synthase